MSNSESCDEDDGEVGEGVVEEELADKPRNSLIFAIKFLPIFDEMWFLTASPAVCIPMILT